MGVKAIYKTKATAKYLPLINGPILEYWPGRTGYSIYFGIIVVTGLIGAVTAFRLQRLLAAREVVQ